MLNQRPAIGRTALAVALLTLTCGAPKSRPADGPIADQVVKAIQSGEQAFDHAEWDALLAAAVRDGLVDYPVMTRRRKELDAYLKRIAAADLARLRSNELKALLINAYNALTVRSILDHMPVKSIRDIDGVWKKTRHEVGGHMLTLDEIEHTLLRPYWKDPRIHFAVNCASMSCAPLPPWAFTGARLDQQLEERTRVFLTDPKQVRLNDGRLYVSKYFDWYGDDFQSDGWKPRADTWLQFIARYAVKEVKDYIAASEEPKVEYLDYDWSLNQAR